MRRRVGATAEQRRALWRRLEESPEATLEEHREAWERERGVRVSVATNEPGDPPAWVDLQAKTVGASERDEEARSAWRDGVNKLDQERLVFVDECGTNVGLAPLRARAPRGERAHGAAPRNRGKNTTLIASMRADGMGPSAAVEGATTGTVFEASTSSRCSPPRCGRARWS